MVASPSCVPEDPIPTRAASWNGRGPSLRSASRMVAAAPDAGPHPSVSALVEPVSARASLRCRATGFRGQRQKARNGLPNLIAPLQRLSDHEMPPNRGYSRGFRKSPVARGCVVTDAVVVEPVSTPEFPANREKNREFFVSWELSRHLGLSSPMNSGALRQIP